MLRALLWLVVVGALAYIAWAYATPQVRAWRFRDAMQQSARLGRATSESEIRAALLESAADLEVPLAPAELLVQRSPRGSGVRIRAGWEEIVRIDGRILGTWVDTLHFDYDTRTERSEP